MGALFQVIASVRAAVRRAYYRARGVEIGRSTYIAPTAYLDTHRPGRVRIGDNCYITRNVVILCHTDTRRGGPEAIWGGRQYGDVTIGDNVFIGVNSVVMPGVTIGDDVIVGALTLVDKDVPAGKVVVGAPARVVGDTRDYLRREE